MGNICMGYMKKILLTLIIACSSGALASEVKKVLTEDEARELIGTSLCPDNFKPSLYFYERVKLSSYTYSDGNVVLDDAGMKQCDTGESEYGSLCIELLCTLDMLVDKDSK